MKKQAYLWLALTITGILAVHLSFDSGHSLVFGRICYAQESDQVKEEIFREANDALTKAEGEDDVISLSPSNYFKAIAAYQEAEDYYEAGELDKVRESLKRTIEYINAGYEKAKQSRVVLKDLMKTREEAKALAIPERAAYIFAKPDSMFSDAAGKVDEDFLESATYIAADAEREYRSAVMEGLRSFILPAARRKLREKEGAIPEESLREAEAELDKIEALLDQQAADFAVGELIDDVNTRIQRTLDSADIKPSDLVVEKLTLSPENPQMGESVTIRALIKNVGDGPASGIVVLFLSQGQRIGRDSIESLEPTQAKEAEITATAPELDKYLINVRVDPDNLVAESNDQNNEKQRSFTVLPRESPGGSLMRYVILFAVAFILGFVIAFLALKSRRKAPVVDTAPVVEKVPVVEKAPVAPVRDRVFKVTGRVLEPDSTPVNGAVIRAYDKRLNREVLMGEVATGEDGRYVVEYAPEELIRAEKNQPDLIVRAFDQEDREIALSEVIFSALKLETVNLTLDKQEHEEPSEPVEPSIQPEIIEHVPEQREPLPPRTTFLEDLINTAQELARLDVNSWLEFINTVILDGSDGLLMFSVNWTAELQDTLDNGSVPDKLRQRYLDNEFPLSDDANVLPEEAGNNWLITDDGQTYTVRKEGDKLNIYMIFKEPVPRITKNCVGCGDCVKICPVKVIRLTQRSDKSKKAVINLRECISCFSCHEVCKYDGVEPYIPMLWRIYRGRISNQVSAPSYSASH